MKTASEIFTTNFGFACPISSKDFTEKMLFCPFCPYFTYCFIQRKIMQLFNFVPKNSAKTNVKQCPLCQNVQSERRFDIIREVLVLIFAVHVVIHWNVFIYRSTHTQTHTHTHTNWTVTKIIHFLSLTQATLLLIVTSFILVTSIYDLPPVLYEVLFFSQNIKFSKMLLTLQSRVSHITLRRIIRIMLLESTSK